MISSHNQLCEIHLTSCTKPFLVALPGAMYSEVWTVTLLISIDCEWLITLDPAHGVMSSQWLPQVSWTAVTALSKIFCDVTVLSNIFYITLKYCKNCTHLKKSMVDNSSWCKGPSTSELVSKLTLPLFQTNLVSGDFFMGFLSPSIFSQFSHRFSQLIWKPLTYWPTTIRLGFSHSRFTWQCTCAELHNSFWWAAHNNTFINQFISIDFILYCS